MSRPDFKAKVEGYISGALGEYVKAEVAERNGYTKYVQHWRGEVERLIWFELPIFLEEQTTKTNFDRRRIVDEIVQEYQPQFLSWMNSTRTTLASNYFRFEKRKTDFKLPDANTSAAAFWLMVEQSVDSALENSND
jgi:hypothetical protein